VASSCKGRHIQKLHDFLKDVFREENRVNVVHGGDEWEESDEAWELGEEEMMIVRTVQQEDNCSWQDACNTWGEQDEETAAGVHQVRVGQEVAEQAAAGQCKKASTAEGNEELPELDGLLVEGGGTGVLPRAADEEGIARTTQGKPINKKQGRPYSG
jgi:hypothetical protein